jgi:hypothetical protein
VEDEDLITLSPDSREVVTKQLREGISALATVLDILKGSDTLSAGITRTVLRVTEYALSDVAKTTGIETQTRADIEQRHADVRRLNMRVRELESQIGAGASPEILKHGLTAASAKLKAWWRAEGFGHTAELSFTDYGKIKATLSCHLFGRHIYSMSKTPLSDREKHERWISSLEERGFTLHFPEGRGDPEIEDCDRSRQGIARLLRSRLPSCDIAQTRNHKGYQTEKLSLKDVEIYIHDLADVFALPTPPNEDD